MMTKAVFVEPPGGLDKLVLGKTETTEPKADEISVRVHASSLNFHDYGVVLGKMRHLTAPLIPMSDGAGEVIAVGESVTEFKVGDHVVSTFFPSWQDGEPRIEGFSSAPGDGSDGFAREFVTMKAHGFTHAPKDYSFTESATLTCAGLTAWRALFADGRLKPGDIVLTQGSGGVSVFAIQFAKAAGATVIATSSSDEKLERLAQLGADHLINYRKDEEWGKTALRMTQGQGVDHIVEVGGAKTMAQSMIAVRPGGHIAVIGILSGRTASFFITPILFKQIQMRGLLVGSRQNQIDMIRAIDNLKLKPVIDRCFTLEDIADAFRYQSENRHFGKICLTI